MDNIKVVWYEKNCNGKRTLGADYLDNFKKQNITPVRYRIDMISQEYVTKLIRLLNADTEESTEAFVEAIERELGPEAPGYTIYN